MPFVLLAIARPSFAQPAQPAERAAQPDPDSPPSGYYPPPGYYPAPDAYPPPEYPASPEMHGPPAQTAAVAPTATVAQSTRPYSLGATLSSSIETEPGSTSVVNSPLLEGAYFVHPRVRIALSLGFGWLLDNQGLGESTFRAGNPQLSGHYHVPHGAWNFDVGLGVTAPLARVPLGPDGRLYAQLYNRTLAMWGMWNQWLWLTDRMAVPAMFRASYTLSGGQVLVAEQSDALLIGVVNGASGTDFVGQVALEAQIPISSSFVLCPRWQTVLLPQASIDRLQSAASLRGTFVTSAGRFFLGVLVNLDEPIAAQGGIERWGLHIGKEIDL